MKFAAVCVLSLLAMMKSLTSSLWTCVEIQLLILKHGLVVKRRKSGPGRPGSFPGQPLRMLVGIRTL